MVSNYQCGQINYLDRWCYVPLDQHKFNVPEYFDQVTKGRNTSLVHAKYSALNINGLLPLDSGKSMLYPDDYGIITDQIVDYHYTVTRSDYAADVFSTWDRRFKRSGVYMRHVRSYKYRFYKNSDGRWYFRDGEQSVLLMESSPSEASPEVLFPFGTRSPLSSRVYNVRLDDSVLSQIPLPQQFFVFAEPKRARGGMWWHELLVTQVMQDMTVAAWGNLSLLNENTLQNILGAVSFILEFATGKIAVDAIDFLSFMKKIRLMYYNTSFKTFFSQLLAGLKRYGPSLWLKYRYVYNTGAMDYRQALDYLERQAAAYSGKMQRFDANATLKVEGLSTFWHLEFFAGLRNDDILTMLSSRAWIQGMELNPYVVWDFIPFSFVVDWFVPVGDKLSLLSNSKHWFADYKTEHICWSVKYYVESQFGTVELYYRFYGPFPVLDGYTHFNNSATASTTLKRVADSTSLILGGISNG